MNRQRLAFKRNGLRWGTEVRKDKQNQIKRTVFMAGMAPKHPCD